MQKLLLFLLLFADVYTDRGQAYIPMPADSGAAWRYRIYDLDATTQIIDNLLFLDGTDTIAYGNTYHKIRSRSYSRVVASGYDPPIVPVVANFPDIYYGAMRESGKKVYLLTLSGEELMYDFNAAVGDSVPAYLSKNKVTAIDSVYLDGVFHNRYLTTDPTYYVIEGVGSNRGLIPDLNDYGPDIAFYCFTDDSLTYTPDTSIPCTFVYPLGYGTSVKIVTNTSEVEIYPNPAKDEVYISYSGQYELPVVIFNCLGQRVWGGAINSNINIPVDDWTKGIYYVQYMDNGAVPNVKKLILE